MTDFTAGLVRMPQKISCKEAGMSSYRWAKAATYSKRVAFFLLAIFLTFAPPGTLILCTILLLWLIGNVWVMVGVVFSLALMAVLPHSQEIR